MGVHDATAFVDLLASVGIPRATAEAATTWLLGIGLPPELLAASLGWGVLARKVVWPLVTMERPDDGGPFVPKGLRGSLVSILSAVAGGAVAVTASDPIMHGAGAGLLGALASMVWHDATKARR